MHQRRPNPRVTGCVLSEEELARASHQAQVMYRTQPEDIEAVLDRHPNAPGAGALRGVLRGDVKTTLSNLERRFLDLLRTNDLALPETNKNHDRRYIDCRWPDRRLTVELDSYRYHATRHAWEQRTASVNVRRERAATTSAASRQATSSSVHRKYSQS